MVARIDDGGPDLEIFTSTHGMRPLERCRTS